MILAIDLGNTNISIGLCEGTEVLRAYRISTDHGKTADDFWVTFSTLLKRETDPEGVVLSSVVPAVEREILLMCERYVEADTLQVNPIEMNLLPLEVDNPGEVGADRVVNCYAASILYGRPAVVVDFGTATTFDILSPEGGYSGGVIIPGPRLAAEALAQSTSLLPRVELRRPPSIIGKNTVDCMRAGLYYGLLGQVEGIIERLREEIAEDLQVIATGGLSKLIAGECPVIDSVEPHLTLRGLAMIYEDYTGE